MLEIGIGTGLNLPFYDRSKVQELVGVDPAAQMHPRAIRRSKCACIPVDMKTISAERLPFESASFDCVVCTYTLCTVTDPVAVLLEIRRVLRPNGKLLLAEHGLAPDPAVARWQFRLEPYWSKIAGGCHLTRDVSKLLEEAGFTTATIDSAYVTRPKAMTYTYWGEAMLL